MPRPLRHIGGRILQARRLGVARGEVAAFVAAEQPLRPSMIPHLLRVLVPIALLGAWALVRLPRWLGLAAVAAFVDAQADELVMGPPSTKRLARLRRLPRSGRDPATRER